MSLYTMSLYLMAAGAAIIILGLLLAWWQDINDRRGK